MPLFTLLLHMLLLAIGKHLDQNCLAGNDVRVTSGFPDMDEKGFPVNVVTSILFI